MKTLYVPIGVELLMTGGGNQDEKRVMLAAPNYNLIGHPTFLGDRIENTPFNVRGGVLPSGVHLHFILPDALTHGEQHNENIEYPIIPNRWLVARIEAKDKLRVTCWIVESDYIGIDNKDSIPIPDFGNVTSGHKYLGRCYELDNSPQSESLHMDEFKLTAIGPGDPAFAAYYPSCRSVLGFHDPLTNYKEGNFTYLVMGYYGDLSNDPLHGLDRDAIVKLLEKNEWHVEHLEDLPECTVCHGMIYNVKWEGPDKEYPSGAQDGKFNAAVGNTSIEAISALISKKMEESNYGNFKNLERFLTSLQNDLMDVLEGVDGIPDVEDMLHKEGFTPETGDNIWIISQTEQPNENQGEELPIDIGVLLSKLNTMQRTLEEMERKKEWLQSAIFCSWHLYESRIELNTPHPKPDQKSVGIEINRLISQYDDLEKIMTSKQLEIESLKDELTQELKDNNRYNLKLKPGENYYTPKEPVLLLSGDRISRPFIFGQDGRFRSDEKLECRLETVSGLHGNNRDLSKYEILSYFGKVPKTELDCFSNLLCEAVCLSPAFVRWIASKANVEILTPLDPLPSKLSWKTWTQSWVTLFLEWKLQYAPTKGLESNTDDSMKGWTLEDVDYHFNGKLPTSTTETTGRSILTPLSTQLLEKTLEKYLIRHQSQELKEILNDIKNLAVVSQRMGDFNVQLLSKTQAVQLPIMTKSKKEEDINLTFHVQRCLQNGNLVPENNTARFLPVRAGFLKIGRVDVCSSFGRREILTDWIQDIAYSEHFPAMTDGFCQLPPRLVQGSRILFDLISNKDNQVRSGLTEDTSPICGYLVPNILDANLLVFDLNGVWLGMLKGIYERGKLLGVWMNAPGKTRADLSNPHLKGFVEGIEKYKDTGDPAFGAIMKLIDKRLSLTDNIETGDSLASIWGRPIALVRARLSMQLLGNPAYSMKLKEFGKYETDKFEEIRYPLLIGDLARIRDGVIGYYCDEDSDRGYAGYRKLYCANNSGDIEPNTKYLEHTKKVTVCSNDKKSTYITLLLEPGSRISIRSGILPAIYSHLFTEHYQNVMGKLHFMLEANPVLTELSDGTEIYIPVPKENDGSWTWNHLDKDGKFIDRPDILNPEAVFHSDNPQLVEGYLIRREGEDE